MDTRSPLDVLLDINPDPPSSIERYSHTRRHSSNDRVSFERHDIDGYEGKRELAPSKTARNVKPQRAETRRERAC